MHRSDRIYLSRFALDPDPEYLDLVDLDFDCDIDIGEFDEEILPDDEMESVNRSPGKNQSRRQC